MFEYKMDSLKQLLDLSEMKHALEILKEEVERLLTSDFNVSEFEKQLPINTKLAEDVDDSESHSEFISKHQNKLKNVLNRAPFSGRRMTFQLTNLLRMFYHSKEIHMFCHGSNPAFFRDPD